MTTRHNPDAIPTLALALIALLGAGGLALLPPDGTVAGVSPLLLAFKLRSFALIGLAGLACASAARAWPRYMIRLGEAQRWLVTIAAGMAMCFVGLVALERAGPGLPSLPAITGPLICVGAFLLLALRQREERRARQLADRLR
jgi:hypothetical protein